MTPFHTQFFILIFLIGLPSAVFTLQHGNRDFVYPAIDPEKLFRAFEDGELTEDAYQRHGIVRRMEALNAVQEDPKTLSTTKPEVTTVVENVETTKFSEFEKEGTTTPVPKIKKKGQGTTKKPAKLLKPYLEKKKYELDSCICNYHMSICDMNCCCDPDCSIEEKEVFTECEDQLLYEKLYGERQCYPSSMIYTHNVPYEIDTSNDGLFCVVTDNSASRELDIPMDKLDKIMEAASKERPAFNWDSLRDEATLPFEPVPYKYDSVIWGIQKLPSDHNEKRNVTIPISLPVAFHGSRCNVNEPLHYLQKKHSTCKLSLKNLKNKCEQLKDLNAQEIFRDILVFKNPATYPNSTLTKPMKFICHVSQNGKKICNYESKVPNYSPKVDDKTNFCRNVLKQVNITVFHSGINGIDHMRVECLLANMSLQESSDFFQEFTVSFKWANLSFQVNNTLEWSDIPIPRVYERSGLPGYIVGKPLIIGRKVPVDSLPNYEKNVTKENDEEKEQGTEVQKLKQKKRPKEVILLNEQNYWMKILAPGTCPEDTKELTGEKRIPVVFNYGHRSSCFLDTRKFKYCYDLQVHIAKILLGDDNVTKFEKQGWHIASYGNSDPVYPENWVPVDYINFPLVYSSDKKKKSLVSSGCNGIVSSFHILVAHALTGPVDFPQSRIIGVLYERGDSYRLPSFEEKPCHKRGDCNAMDFAIEVGTYVAFIDKTTPPVMNYGKWPSITIRLPADFFYPFSVLMSSSSVSSTHQIASMLLLVSPSLLRFFNM